MSKKCRIRETKNLSTDADSSTDTKKILLVRQNSPKNYFFFRDNFTPFMSKTFQIRDHFFPALFPKVSENPKIIDLGPWEVGPKKLLNGT